MKRLLTDKELAVFEAIVDQYKKSETVTDIFVYDLKTGQHFLNDNYMDLNIRISDQWNIIIQLAKEKYINVDLMNEYGNGDKGNRKIKWVFGTEWAREFVQMSDTIEKCFEKYGSKIFISLTVPDINHIRHTYKPAYRTKLVPNFDQLKLDVICSNGKTYTLKAFNRNDGKPYRVFYYIYNNCPNKDIDNIELSKHVEGVAEDEYVSKIYEKNDTIKKTLTSHVLLKPEGMRINIIADQSPAQLEEIEREAVKITKTKTKK